MHNLYANFVKILEICTNFSINLVNELGNIPRPGVVPRFSDLEVVALSLTAEHLSIDFYLCTRNHESQSWLMGVKVY